MITDGQLHMPVEQSNAPKPPDRDAILATIRRRVADNLRTAYEESKKQYDKHTGKVVEYSPGTVVWKRNTKLSNANEFYSSKLDDKFVRCKVIKKTGTSTYLLGDMNGKEIGVFSTKMLRLHH